MAPATNSGPSAESTSVELIPDESIAVFTLSIDRLAVQPMARAAYIDDSVTTGEMMRAEEMLPDRVDQGSFNGVTVRKGTVGAFLVNAKTWNDAAASPDQRAAAERDMQEALSSLRALGLFEVMEIRDERLRAWVNCR